MSTDEFPPYRITARLSPGPWWGFNGVNTLELRNGLVLHSFHILFHGYLVRVYELGEIRVEKHALVTRRGQTWSTLTLRMRDRSQRFVGYPSDCEPFLVELVRWTGPA